MFRFLVLALSALSLASALSDFFDEVELSEVDGIEDPEWIEKYPSKFEAEFTASIYGVSRDTAAGQQDLKKFGRVFLKKFNRVQNVIGTRQSDGDELEEPEDILMYDTEVTSQLVLHGSAEGTEETGDYNMLSIRASFMCTEDGCPAEAKSRQLHSRRLLSVSNKIMNSLLNSGRAYFENVSCVQISSTAVPDFVDESKECTI